MRAIRKKSSVFLIISLHPAVGLAVASCDFSHWLDPPFESLVPEGLPCSGSSSIQNSVGFFLSSPYALPTLGWWHLLLLISELQFLSIVISSALPLSC